MLHNNWTAGLPGHVAEHNVISTRLANVRDYGVLPANPSAINTANLQILINRLAADGGGVIYIPRGRYAFAYGGTAGAPLLQKYGITIPSNINIIGDGMHQTILHSPDVTADPDTHFAIFQIYGYGAANTKANIQIKDIGFEGTNTDGLVCTGNSDRGIFVYGDYIHDVLIDRCRAEFFWESGFAIYAWANNSYKTDITNCISANNGEGGINTSINRSQIINNYCHNNYTAGMELVCKDCVITGNISKNNGFGGIVLGGDLSDTRINHVGWWNTLSNNICTENVGVGIQLTESTCHSVVTGNVCMFNTKSGIHLLEDLPLYPHSHCNYNLVEGNICACNGGPLSTNPYGILVEAEHNTIRGNEVYDLALPGYEQKFGIILQVTADYSLVLDNHTFGNTLSQYTDIGSTGTIYRSLE